MDRNERIRQLYKEGRKLKELSEIFGITRQRIDQIINYEKYKKLKLRAARKIYLNKIKELNERKSVLYSLIDKVSREDIQSVLQGLVIYNQKLRPIEDFFTANFKYNGGRDRFREFVRMRDDHRCQLCGIKKDAGRRLDVHHIYDDNGENTRKCDDKYYEMITLCHQCHLNIDKWKMENTKVEQ